jgi:signal transduction histidine kinase
MRADAWVVRTAWWRILGVIAAGACPDLAFATEPLRSLADIVALAPDDLDSRRPAVVHGVVTLTDPLVIQDGDHAIALAAPASFAVGNGDSPPPLDPIPPLGTWLEVTGFVDPEGRAPTVAVEYLRRLGTRPLPEPVPFDPAQFFAGGSAWRRIRASGVVQAVLDNPEGWSLIFESASRRFRVLIDKTLVESRPDWLIDADVELVGVNNGVYNNRREFIVPRLEVASLDDVRVVRARAADAFDLSVTPLRAIARSRVHERGGHRVRTEGVVSFAVPGFLFVQDDAGGVRVDLTPDPGVTSMFQPGDRVDVAGFPDVTSGIGGLAWAIARKTSSGPAPAPVPIQPSAILRINQASYKTEQRATPGNYEGCLIRCVARVEAVNTSPAGTVLTLLEQGEAFTATLADGGDAAGPQIEPGTDVELTGIVRTQRTLERLGDLFKHTLTPFHVEILVRGADGIRILRLPPWWTPRRLAIALGAIATVLGLAIAWVILLRREVASQTRLLAHEMRSRRDAAIEFDATLRERSRLAANLHDTLLQALAGSVLQIDLCRRSLAGRRVEAAGDQLDVAKRMVKHAADDLRNSVWALRTAPLAGRSLPDSLRAIVSQLGGDAPGQLRLRLDGESFPLPRFVAGNLLLVAQEAIRNAQHHAAATAIDVTVRFDAPARRVALTVSDDGTGFAWGTQRGPERGHFGLQGMRERIEAIRGRFAVETAPGRGTRVTAEVAVQPVDAALHDDEDASGDEATPPARDPGTPSTPVPKPAAAAG